MIRPTRLLVPAFARLSPRLLPFADAAFARADWFHTGEFYYDAGNLGSDDFDLVNFRLGAGGDAGNVGWDVAVFLHNAFDEEYVPIAFQANPADPTQFVGQNGAPQTWGVKGRLLF